MKNIKQHFHSLASRIGTSRQEDSFSYTKLAQDGDFRLLTVEPGSGEAPVRASIRHESLLGSTVPEYETISYVWGNSRRRAAVFIDTKRINVPANAERVLRRMRYHDRPRTLWIDAVCINQDDVEERGTQVALMDVIYKNGVRNLVWLGPAKDDDGEVLRAFEVVLEDMRLATDNFSNTLDILYDLKDALEYSSDPSCFLREQQILDAILSSPWFMRLWVLQEAILAQENLACFGQYELPLISVLRAAMWLMLRRGSVWSFPPGMFNVRTIWSYIEGLYSVNRAPGTRRRCPLTLRALLIQSRDLEASDGRDHVYAILGIYQQHSGREDIPESLRPDYRKPLSAVLRDATRFAIIEEQQGPYPELGILGKVIHRPSDLRHDSGFPSWVPRLDRPMDGKHEPNRIHFFFETDLRVCQPKILAIDSSKPHELELSGFTVGVVADVLEVLTYSHLRSAKSLLAYIRNAQRLAARNVGESHQSQLVALSQTLGAGIGFSDNSASDEDALLGFQSLYEWLEFYKDIPFRGEITSNDSDGPIEGQKSRAAQYLRGMNIYSRNRHMFVTATGEIGLGPLGMQKDDIVVVLYGSRWPLVLRKHGNVYKLCGVCYVYGIMFGEAVQEHQANGGQDQIFCIH